VALQIPSKPQQGEPAPTREGWRNVGRRIHAPLFFFDAGTPDTAGDAHVLCWAPNARAAQTATWATCKRAGHLAVENPEVLHANYKQPPVPRRRGFQSSTVRPRSTSTTMRRSSMRRPSAYLYAPAMRHDIELSGILGSRSQRESPLLALQHERAYCACPVRARTPQKRSREISHLHRPPFESAHGTGMT
jgi:hypothetical protein